jgi:hypothetical protein
MLNSLEIFSFFILEGGKQKGKIQVPAKERRGCYVGIGGEDMWSDSRVLVWPALHSRLHRQ